MKKMVMAMMAALTFSMSTMAQDGKTEATRPERRQMNPAEMIQRRTEATVKQYGLNEEQAKKLQELNTKYPNMVSGPRGGRGGQMGPRRPQGRRGGDANRDSVRRERPQNMDPEQMKARMQEMQKEREAYNAELQKIMTPEQYKAYTEDMEKRMRNMGNRQGGNRGFGNPNGGRRERRDQ